jgi:hypothetical protein
LLPIWDVANNIATVESNLKASYPFDPTQPNGGFIGNTLSQGAAEGANMFAPNYISPRSVQMNFGIQREIRHGMVFTADFLRNVETHGLLGVDINKVGTANNFNATGAEAAVEGAANATSGCTGMVGAGAVNCVIGFYSQPTMNPTDAAGVFLANGLGTPADADGVACPLDPNLNHPCAFGGINPNQNAFAMLFPISRSVYNALQMKLVQNVVNPWRGVKSANFQISYALSRFVNPLAWQGANPPSNAVSANDQDFVLQAADNNDPLRYMGPSLLDRTHQLSFGGNFDVPLGFRLGDKSSRRTSAAVVKAANRCRGRPTARSGVTSTLAA